MITTEPKNLFICLLLNEKERKEIMILKGLFSWKREEREWDEGRPHK